MSSMLQKLKDEIDALESKTIIITTIKRSPEIPAMIPEAKKEESLREFFFNKLHPLILEAKERKIG